MMRRTGHRLNRGGVALEAAFCMPPLLFILGMAVDTAWLSLQQHNVAHAARLASRFGITGNADPVAIGTPLVAMCPGSASVAGMPRVDRIRAIIAAQATGILTSADLCLGIGSYAGYQAVGKPEPLVDINGNGRQDGTELFTDINGNGRWDADQAVPTPGGGEQIAVYILRYTTRTLVGMTPGLEGNIQVEARVVVRNEPA